MPNLETPEELAEEICNWLGLYEPKSTCPLIKWDGACENPNPFCCRLGAMSWLPDRIRQAVRNELLLRKMDLDSPNT